MVSPQPTRTHPYSPALLPASLAIPNGIHNAMQVHEGPFGHGTQDQLRPVARLMPTPQAMSNAMQVHEGPFGHGIHDMHPVSRVTGKRHAESPAQEHQLLQRLYDVGLLYDVPRVHPESLPMVHAVPPPDEGEAQSHHQGRVDVNATDESQQQQPWMMGSVRPRHTRVLGIQVTRRRGLPGGMVHPIPGVLSEEGWSVPQVHGNTVRSHSPLRQGWHAVEGEDVDGNDREE
jgi:hypothetical protein